LTGDRELLAELSADTLRVWHSYDEQWLTREQAEVRMAQAESAAAGQAAMPALQDLRTLVTDTGFVVQAAMAGLGDGGRTHIVQICTVEDGRVTSCEEYIAPGMNLA
jgi:hypothetical protein